LKFPKISALIFILDILIAISARGDLTSDLVKDADRARGGIDQGISWTVKVESFEEGEKSERSYFVKTKGDNAYVETLEPARNKGEVILFNSRLMWFFKPNLRKPVSISARQKLSGQASNGDIASTNYFRDYTATFEKKEEWNKEPVQILLLKAKSTDVTYDQIRYWISEKSRLAVKSEFMTLQGQIFKVATFEYENKLTLDGKTIPFMSRMEIVDAKFKENKSILKYESPQKITISEHCHPV